MQQHARVFEAEPDFRSWKDQIPVDTPGDANHWVNMDPMLALTDERLAELLAYWRKKRGGRFLPARGDIDPGELKPHLGRLHLIDVEYDPFRLRYRLIGTATTKVLDRDMTGRYFDEIYPPHILAEAIRSYSWLVENKRPLRQFGNAIYADKSIYDFEVINLPLSNDGVRVNMVLGELVFSLARPCRAQMAVRT
ncbi:MAG: PAS domain-containing protein [Rhodospirillaceae bacterium]|jgi:hypothetical protein|nr:PAS domain-containing protein [Rhodospirillaceae bacterium]MBT4489807.1 PAS domain-containing protein [Rhodospirillaceae bacterium]MBT5191454.1 PAS domain-containing protein [Rhodospirillaceae bacterium]MBT6426426.1 PAS domain-containing protein [Rhodospirillaceae bacterium]MBT7760945.1 PAS domain-containing protein [Rhodospirillaceae bacterium]